MDDIMKSNVYALINDESAGYVRCARIANEECDTECEERYIAIIQALKDLKIKNCMIWGDNMYEFRERILRYLAKEKLKYAKYIEDDRKHGRQPTERYVICLSLITDIMEEINVIYDEVNP